MGAVLPRKREPRVSGEKACDPGFPPSREHKEARSHVRSCWACRSTAFPTSREERPFDKLRACPGLDPGANGGRLLRVLAGQRGADVGDRLGVALDTDMAAHRFGELLGIFGADLTREIGARGVDRSEEHTSELQSLMRISYAVFCLKIQT